MTNNEERVGGVQNDSINPFGVLSVLAGFLSNRIEVLAGAGAQLIESLRDGTLDARDIAGVIGAVAGIAAGYAISTILAPVGIFGLMFGLAIGTATTIVGISAGHLVIDATRYGGRSAADILKELQINAEDPFNLSEIEGWEVEDWDPPAPTWPSRPFHDIRSMAEIEGWGVEGWGVEPWQDAYDQFQYAAPFTTPLVLDLDGDGIELTSVNGATAFFDVGVDGFAEATGWVAADDGLLVLDVNGNGRIDNGSELFGDQTGHAHGFLALAQHDDNGDGVIDAADAVFGQLRIWQDLNQDGISQAHELRSLAEVGISSISVQSTTTSYWVAGNEIRYESTFTWDDGSVGVVGDAFFASDKIRTKAILADDFEYHPDVFKLPVLAGVGHLASTWVVMSTNDALRQQAMDLVAQASALDFVGFRAAFDDFLMAWGGVENVAPDSLGVNVNAQRLAFMEVVFDEPFIHVGGGFRLVPGSILNAAFEPVFAHTAMQFLSQVAVSDALLNATDVNSFVDLLESNPLTRIVEYSKDATLALIELSSMVDAARIDWGAAHFILKLIEATYPATQDFVTDLTAGIPAVGSGTGAILYKIYELGTDAVVGGNGTLTGTSGMDVLIGGTGDDTLIGGAGSDVYIAIAGSGNDRIAENSANWGEIDTLLFVGGLTIDDVEVTFDGDDMVITYKDHSGSMTIENDAINSALANRHQIQTFAFEDGTSFTRAQFMAAALGTSGDDVFKGSGVSDTFRAAAGQGHDRIVSESSNYQEIDTLLFVGGLTIDDVEVTFDGDDMVITYKDHSGSMTIENDAINSALANRHQIQTFAFEDGTSFTRAQFMAAALGTSGDDVFKGSGVSDTFRAAAGQGHDRIVSDSSNYLEIDTLLFVGGLTIDDVEVRHIGTDMVITYKDQSGSMTIENDGSTSSIASRYQMQIFAFEDGTSFTRDQFIAAAGVPTPNLAPTILVADQTRNVNEWVRLSDVLQFHDADGDSLVTLELMDNQGGQNWWADGGMVNAVNGYATSNLADVWFQADASQSQQTLWVRASDGQDWSDWLGFNLESKAPNRAPTITVSNQVKNVNESISLTALLNFSDADGDILHSVELWDSVGGNNWKVGGQSVNAASGYITTNIAGTSLVADSFGSEQTIWIRASDGQAWSAWSSFVLTSVPTFTFDPSFHGTSGNDVFNGSGMSDTFRAAAGEGDDRIISTSMNGGEVDTLLFVGGLTINDLEVRYVGDDMVITYKGQSGSMTIQGDGNDAWNANRFQIQTYRFEDGTSFTRDQFMAAALGTSGNDVFNGSGMSDTFRAAAGEGDDRIISTSMNGGEVDTLLFVGGLTINDLEVRYVGDDMVITYKGQSGSMTIQGDGNDAWNANRFQIQTYRFEDGTSFTRDQFISIALVSDPNTAPTIHVADQVRNASQWVRLTDVFVFNDVDGDQLSAVEVRDEQGVQNWWADGGMVNASSGYTTSNLAGVWFQGDPTPGQQTLWVRASDGKDWSDWHGFELLTA
jgi:hypothetical protein